MAESENDNPTGGGPFARGETIREMTEDLYMPSIRLGPKIAHYYGDYVRKAFMGLAAGLLILTPFIGSYIPELLVFEIGGALAFIVLAALTNPRKQIIMVADTLLAACAVIAFQLVAFGAYTNGDMVMFIMHEVLALVALFALYYAVKTLRAMTLGIIGHRHTAAEFLREKQEYEDREKKMQELNRELYSD